MDLAQELYNLCVSQEKTLAVAESCTSGLLASQITSVPGSSSYFKGGVVAYQNNIKINILGIRAALIEKHTEVSAEVAEQMAKGVQSLFNTDFAIATTGYAGPSGGTNNNPVGTVFIALVSNKKVLVERLLLKGGRQSIVNQASARAISFLLTEVKKAQ